MSDNNRWLNSLPKPFKAGEAITYQRGWAFSFHSGDNTYLWRNVTYPNKETAAKAMTIFVAKYQ